MSRIQKALAKAKATASHDRKLSQPRGIASSLRQAVKNTGIFKALLSTKIDTAAMARYRILPGVDDNKVATAYKMLRTRILQRMRSNNWNSLLVTGPGPNEGKTITAANLAISISKDINQSTILVDLDLPRPSLTEYFGLTVDAGLGEFLKGEANLEDIIYVPDGLERLTMIPNREPIENSSDLIASPRMHELIAWTRDHGDATVTIFDMPPVLATDDVLAFCEYVDTVLLVVSQGMTDRQALAKTVQLLSDYELLGVILNRSSQIVGQTAYSYY